MILAETVFDENLKEKPLNSDHWIKFKDEILEKLKIETEIFQKIDLLGLLGHSNKLLKHFKSAEDHLHEAISLSIIQNLPKKIVQNQLRLADVFRYQNIFAKSEVLFDQTRNLLNQTADAESLMASYHQHFGKYYFDQNFHGLAICHFKLALRIRRRLNASVDQINSSMASIAESEKRSNDHIQNDITIRIAEIADAENIHHAHMRSINEICSKDHSVDEIRVWGGRTYNPEVRIPAIQNQFYLAVEYKNKIEGFCQIKINTVEDLKSAHLYGFYITPEILKQKVGHQMMKLVFEYCVAHQISQITLRSSFTAFDFYKKYGFIQNGEMGGTIRDGILLRGYPMKKVFNEKK